MPRCGIEWFWRIALLGIVGLPFAGPIPYAVAVPTIEVTVAPTVLERPTSGRVLVLFGPAGQNRPSARFDWFHPHPMIAVDVRALQPGGTVRLDRTSMGFPTPLDGIAPGNYALQAIFDKDQGYRNFAEAPGNGTSVVHPIAFNPYGADVIRITIDQTFPEPGFQETDRIRLFEVESRLLSEFAGRPIQLRAGVLLPETFASQPNMRYPVVYEVPGFGGDHRAIFGRALQNASDLGPVECLYVMLDPNCRTGHHVFADSENNGPFGQALIEELIPALEAKFRGIGEGRARFVKGHSSGGWSSLWLQIRYPESFGGCWSTAPDPVDFRDFQRINLYSDANLFLDAEGQPRPLARRGGQPVLFVKRFSDMERVMGHGGQLGSFEAVFSPKGADGQPMPLWDRETGMIHRPTARAWRQYDIGEILEENFAELGPRLAGKIHVFMGSEDTFYLEGATRLLAERLRRLGSDAVVEIHDGKDHATLITPALRDRIRNEIAKAYLTNKPVARTDTSLPYLTPTTAAPP